MDTARMPSDFCEEDRLQSYIRLAIVRGDITFML